MAPSGSLTHQWRLPDPRRSPVGEDLVGVGADCKPGTMLAGYRSGLFPMGLDHSILGWYSPDPRGILPLDGVHVSRSLRRSMRRFRTTIDQAFPDVLAKCADTAREGHWIGAEFIATYNTLWEHGYAHSVEVWDGNVLAGGLFGVEVGGLFAGESMFHCVTDASKAAMVATVQRLRSVPGPRLFDVQWSTPHLASMGVIEIPRADYLARLPEVNPTPPAFPRR